MALRACRRLVLLVDPLGPSTSAALRMALTRFATLLALQQTEDVDVGLAMVARSGASVQLKVLYKPSRFVLRDFAVAVARLQPDVGPEGAAAWRAPDTKKLFLALRSLIQHLAAQQHPHPHQQQQQQGPHPRPPPSAPTPTRLVVLAHSFSLLAGNTLSRTLEEAVAAAIDVAFVRLGDEEVGDGGEGGHGAAAEVAGEAAQPAGGPEAAAAAAAASEAFGRAVADSAHGAYEQLQAADAASLEHVYMRWLRSLAQPLRDTHVRLELAAAGQPGPTGQGQGQGQGQEIRAEQQQEQGPAGGNGGSSGASWFRGRLASQLGALGPRATPCPLCRCHGLPTAPPPTGSLAPRVCAASGAPLLPRDAPPDPLTVRLGPWGLQELRLGPGAGPAALQAVVPDQPEDGDPRGGAGGGEAAMQGLAPHSMGNTARALAEGGAPHVVRLVVERVVPYEEVDASLVYGWPQLLLPVDGAGGAGAGRGNAEADEEASLGELTFGAVSQVLQQCGGVLVAYGNVALCDGPTGHWGHGGRAGGRAPPPPTSLRQWYLLVPGHNSFLLRQVACREQLIPLQPPTIDADPTPDAIASAEHAMRQLPGWVAGTAATAAPITVHTAPQELPGLEHNPAAPTGIAAEGSHGAILHAGEAMRDGATAVAAEPAGPPPVEPAAAAAVAEAAACTGAEDPGALATTLAACSLADAHAAQGLEGQQQQHQQQQEEEEEQQRAAPSAMGPVAAVAAAGTEAAEVARAGSPEAPGSGFSPLLLSSGCHEVVAALLRGSVRLAPRPQQQPQQQQPQRSPQQSAGPMGGAAAGAMGYAGHPPQVPQYGQQPQQQQGARGSAGAADVPYPLDPRQQQQQQQQQQLYYQQQQPQQLQGQERPGSGSGAPPPAASTGGRLALSRALGMGPRGGGPGTAAAGQQQQHYQQPQQYQQQHQQPASSALVAGAAGARGAGAGGGGGGGGGGGMPGRAAGGGQALRSGSPAASASGPAGAQGGQGGQQQPQQQPQQQGGAGGRRQALRLAPSRK